MSKNAYKIVLDAIMALPWCEGLCGCEFVNDEGLCCALGAAYFIGIPKATRLELLRSSPVVIDERIAVGRNELLMISGRNDDLLTIVDENNRIYEELADETPLDRKERMCRWLRERATQ